MEAIPAAAWDVFELEHGAGAREWLELAPVQIDQALRFWQLERDRGELRHGHCSLAIPVIAAGERAVLKLCISAAILENEIEALAVMRGHGAPAGEVIASRRLGDGAVCLMTRYEPLVTLDFESYLEILVRLKTRLPRRLDGRFMSMEENLDRMLRNISERGQTLASPLFSNAEMIRLEALKCSLMAGLDGHPSYLNHGDLRPEQIMLGPDGPVAIDPSPKTGDPIYDVAYLLSHLAFDHGENLAEISARAGREFGLEGDSIQGWAALIAANKATSAACKGLIERASAAAALARSAI